MAVKYWHKHLSNISDKAKIGDGAVIHAGVHIHDEVIIGENCKIEAGAFLPNGVTLAENVFIGPGTVFTNDKAMDMSQPFKPLKTQINANVKIGANCTILPGITIGEGAKIGAGSVVVESVPPNVTVYGNPARLKENPSRSHSAGLSTTRPRGSERDIDAGPQGPDEPHS